MRGVVAGATEPDKVHVAVDDHRLGLGRRADQAKTGRCLAFIHLASGGQIVILAMLDKGPVEHAAI